MCHSKSIHQPPYHHPSTDFHRSIEEWGTFTLEHLCFGGNGRTAWPPRLVMLLLLLLTKFLLCSTTWILAQTKTVATIKYKAVASVSTTIAEEERTHGWTTGRLTLLHLGIVYKFVCACGQKCFHQNFTEVVCYRFRMPFFLTFKAEAAYMY